jgi:hypothetical protein
MQVELATLWEPRAISVLMALTSWPPWKDLTSQNYKTLSVEELEGMTEIIKALKLEWSRSRVLRW